MMIKKIYPLGLTILLLYFTSCAFFQEDDLNLEKTILSGKKVSFVPLDIDYMRTKNFNKVWSKVYSDKYYPYRKLLNKEFTIQGQSNIEGVNYIIIKDHKNKSFKSELKFNGTGIILNSSYILLNDDYVKAKDLINRFIWLNYLNNENIFFTYDKIKFSRFQKVKVIDLMKLLLPSEILKIFSYHR